MRLDSFPPGSNPQNIGLLWFIRLNVGWLLRITLSPIHLLKCMKRSPRGVCDTPPAVAKVAKRGGSEEPCESTPVPCDSTPVCTRTEDAMPTHNENLGQTNGVKTPPNAKELAAARAARIRLGLEKPDPSDPLGDAFPAAEEKVIKLPDGVEPENVEIVNLPSDQLQAFDAAEVGKELEGLEGKLDSKGWVIACDGLNTLRRLAIHNREELRPQTGPAVLLCFKSVKNLRSAVQRSALICLQDIVVIYGDAVLASLSVGKPPNLQQILLRAAQDKRFVADEAERLLQLIAENCDLGLFLDDLLPFVENKSPKVRVEAAKAVKVVVYTMHEKAGSQAVKDACFPRILKLTGKLMVDSQPGARSAAQELTLKLHTVHADDSTWEELCKKELTATEAGKVVKHCSENTSGSTK